MSLDQQKVQSAERVYEDFEPPSDWVHDESSDTLILMLPGFKREHLKVEIASTRILRLRGERQISENKWRQFLKEFAIPHESDTSKVSAKFESGMLYIKLPKHINPIKTQPIIQEAPKNPQQPTPNAKPNHQQKPMDNASSQAKTGKTTNPPPPTPNAPYQKEPKLVEESQKKQTLVEKTAEASKDEKTRAAGALKAAALAAAALAAPTPVAPLEETKKEVDDAVKKPQKEKGKSEATTSRAQGVSEANILTKRSQTLELLSRQSQEYKNAVSGLVEEVKKQKKMVNMIVVIFLVLVFGFYVKNAMKSSLGGPKIEDL